MALKRYADCLSRQNFADRRILRQFIFGRLAEVVSCKRIYGLEALLMVSGKSLEALGGEDGATHVVAAGPASHSEQLVESSPQSRPQR